jgi:hypothetical protein
MLELSLRGTKELLNIKKIISRFDKFFSIIIKSENMKIFLLTYIFFFYLCEHNIFN